MATPIVSNGAARPLGVPRFPVFSVEIVRVADDANAIITAADGEIVDFQLFGPAEIAAAALLGVSLEAVARLRYAGRRIGGTI